MEAAASGRPLVLTDIRGCRQVAEPGSNGLLVPVGNALQLANAIRTLCDDSTLRARMGAESARRAQREFDEDRVVRTVMTTYYELARRKGLPWLAPEAVTEARLRSATTDDAMAIARLHIEMITKGFLSTLGPRFLKVLYSALIESEYGRVLVVDAQQTVLGFIAGATDTSRFYKEFSRRYRWTALRTLLPALARPRTWKRIWETLRYGTGESEVRAELLSMAVTPAAQGLGWGRRLVEALLEEVHGEGHLQMKVIVGADNTVARALYEKSGFVGATRFEVHSGTPSLELTWRP
jgi:ribosomal protein S18 acetylase RimI-like enzyme